jgi:hypothetical protein
MRERLDQVLTRRKAPSENDAASADAIVIGSLKAVAGSPDPFASAAVRVSS